MGKLGIPGATIFGRLILAILAVATFHHPACAMDNVTLITDFGFNGRHAYYFVAIEKGYYKAADLEVKVVRGQGSVDAIRQVGANNAIVGFADAGSLVLARGNDQIPVKLVSIVLRQAGASNLLSRGFRFQAAKGP
jgi:NitT/TauT family transport system substrate-binding protein